MVVEIRLYATLRGHVPAAAAGVLSMEVPEGSTVAEVLKMMGIELAEVHIIMINGVSRSLDNVLHNGDRLGLFPPVGGG
jgi:molybdopterin converting factor small subunit